MRIKREIGGYTVAPVPSSCNRAAQNELARVVTLLHSFSQFSRAMKD